jgi:hypothetical protein
MERMIRFVKDWIFRILGRDWMWHLIHDLLAKTVRKEDREEEQADEGDKDLWREERRLEFFFFFFLLLLPSFIRKTFNSFQYNNKSERRKNKESRTVNKFVW